MNLTAPLELRPIPGVQPLDDGESDLQSSKPKRASGGLLDKARSMFKRERDPVAAFATALGSVRQLLSQFDVLEAKHKAACDTRAYDKYAEKMRANYNQNPCPETHALLYVALAIQKERQNEVAMLQRSVYHNPLEAQWMQSPGIREKIARAVALKIEVARRELEVARRNEAKRLGPRYDANDSPIVKDHAGRVATWERQLEELSKRDTIYEPVIEARRFLGAVKLLLEGDESTAKRYVYKEQKGDKPDGVMRDGDVYELDYIEEADDNPETAEFQKPYHLRGITNHKSWTGSKADFEKCFKKI